MIKNWVGRIFVSGLLAVAVGVMALGGYFYYKAGQPMQVAAAQRFAPGITYREFWADRIQRWNEIDDQKVSQGKGKACVITGHVMLSTWILPGSIFNVTRIHNNPKTKLAESIIKSVRGIIPPDNLLYGSISELPNAWWWEIENMSWYYFYRPQARAWNCEVGAPRKSVQK
jgi:hypothetical protein